MVPPKKSSTERMRRLRERRRHGTVTLPQFEVTASVIAALIDQGFLDAEGVGDREAIKAALDGMIEQSIEFPVEVVYSLSKPRHRPRLRSALKLVTFGLL